MNHNEKTFIYDFLTGSWLKIEQGNPCGPLNSKPYLACELHNNVVVIPSATWEGKNPCTALFNVDSFEWSKLEKDHRLHAEAGRLIKSDQKLYFLGGLDNYGNGTKFIYELVNNSNWQLLKEKLPVNIGGVSVLVPVNEDFCTGSITFYDHGQVITKDMLKPSSNNVCIFCTVKCFMKILCLRMSKMLSTP